MESFTIFVQLFLSLILVISTIIYVRYTMKLVKETKKIREFELKPYIILYFESAEADPRSQYLCIKNLGKGTAKNVTFEIIEDFKLFGEFDRTLESEKYLTRNYPYFPPNYNFKMWAFNFNENYEEKVNSRIVVKCYYMDVLGKTYEETFVLNLSNGFDYTKMTPPDNYIGLISHEIKKLREDFNKTISKKDK